MIQTYILGPKPQLTIEKAGSKNLGRCYNSSTYKVTSLQALSIEDLVLIRKAGFLGSGQEFMCRYVSNTGTKVPVPAKLDYMSVKDVVPTGCDMVRGTEVEEDTWMILGPSKCEHMYEVNYFVYECESRVDSSD